MSRLLAPLRTPSSAFRVIPILALTVACLGLAPGAAAQDLVGIYWDAGYTTDVAYTPTVPGTITGYVVLHDATGTGGVLGWEACLDIDGPASVVGWDFQGQAVNVGQTPCLAVGYTSPLPQSANILLATFTAVASDVGPIEFGMKPMWSASLPNEMSYIPGDAPGDLIAMRTVTGREVVAGLNGGNPWLTFNMTTIDFGAPAIGETATDILIIDNEGPTPITIEPVIQEFCDFFGLPGGSGPFTVPAYGRLVIDVTFTPVQERQVICSLDLGPDLPVIELRGAGTVPATDWYFSGSGSFGNVAVGASSVRNVRLTNTGETTIPLDVSFQGSCTAFTLTGGGGPRNLAPGGSVLFSVVFSPTVGGYQFCDLSMGNSQLGSFRFEGVGVLPALAWEAPTSYNFLGQFVDVPTTAGLTITNVGASAFDVIATLPGDCDAFTILQGGGYVHTLQPGQSHGVLVEFNAPAPGHFECVLDLGAIVPGIQLLGDGLPSPSAISATPSQLVFPNTLVGLSGEMDVILANTVSYDVPIDVQIAGPSSVFSLVAGGGSRILTSGTSQVVTVRFTPGAVVDYNDALSLGGTLDPVPLQGSGYAGSPDCRIEPTALSFGSVDLGSSADLPVTITNDGVNNLLLEFSTTEADFFIDEAPVLLAPGQQRTVNVRYQPASLGGHSGFLLLGDAACNAVSLLGNATIDSNQFSVAPDTVNFGVVGTGVAANQDVLVTNNSPGILELNVQLQAPTDGFSLLQGAGPRTLFPGDSQTISVRFLSLTTQSYATGLYLGVGLPLVPVLAESQVILPDCVLSAANVNFEEVTIGTTATRTVDVTNNSDSAIVLTPTSDSPEFSTAADSILVAAGATYALQVSFSPVDAAAYSGSIALGPAACSDIGCFGSGVPNQEPGQDVIGIFFDGAYQQNVAYSESIGQIIPGYLVLSNPSNTGGVLGWEGKVDLTGPVTISGWNLAGQAINLSTAPEFVVGLSAPLPFTDTVLLASFVGVVTGLDGSAVFSLNPVQTPSLPGEMAWIPGDLPGALLPMNPLLGQPEVAYIYANLVTVSPDTVDIPAVAVGTIVDRQILVTNQSTNLVQLNVQLQEPTYGFTLLQGSGNHSLAPGNTRVIVLRFQCLTPQTYETALNLGAGLPPVPVFAVGVLIEPDCVLSDPILNFGTVGIGTGEWHTTTVTNNSDDTMVLTPISDNPVFRVAQDTVTVAPDSTGYISIGFVPTDAASYSGTISLGETGCAEILCEGIGVPEQTLDQDLLGIYFDAQYYENFAFAQSIGQLIEGHVVLSNPSNSGGVLGWECKVGVTGPAVILGWDLAGQAINLRTAPEFIVGLNEPLPFVSGHSLLTTFHCVLTGLDQDVVFSVLPVRTPSLPDEMAWIPGDIPGALLPMRPVLGQPEVAFITTAIVGTLAETPQAELLGGRVDLSWPMPLTLNDGCHVYRRTADTDPIRLTTEPIAATGQKFIFTDAAGDVKPGSTVYYSYAIVRNGQELARSAEAEVTLPGLPVAVTQLLPNVPNPFNPMTEIRFQLHKPQTVSLRIYDITGRLVRELVNGSLPAGPHARIWQGRDNRDRQVPSGAYYLRLVTEGKVDNSKIMLLK